MINPDLVPLAKPLGWFRTDARNARRHGEASYAAIATSLRRYGQQKPVVCLADGTVIAGNGTLEAAKRLGWDRLAAVTFPDATTARAYAIADNRTAELSEWEPEALAQAIAEISQQALTLGDVGWDDGALAAVMGEWNVQPVEMPDVTGSPVPPEHHKTFTAVLNDAQSDVVERAMRKAGAPGTGKELRGAALAAIAAAYLGEEVDLGNG